MRDIRPTHVTINLDAIAHNLRGIRRHIGPGVRMLAAVKADAYGHGLVETATVAIREGADMLGVAIVEEGVALREAGFTGPVLILSASLPDQAGTIVQHDLTPMVCTLELAEALAAQAIAAGTTVRTHVKVDTGMGRLGISVGDACAFLRRIVGFPSLIVEGIFTHFACADEQDKSFTRRQMERFSGLLEDLDNAGLRPPLAHAANSGAILDMPESWLDMVRPGLIIYGYYPSRSVSRSIPLRPAMTWKTRIVYLKRVNAGTGLCYGLTYVTPTNTLIASLPVGYDDGYRRSLSNRGVVLVRGRRAPVVGRVCMDQCLIDVGHIPDVAVGDEVVLIGRQGQDEIPMEEMARKLGTITNEVVCMVGKRVPRVFVKDEPGKDV